MEYYYKKGSKRPWHVVCSMTNALIATYVCETAVFVNYPEARFNILTS